MSFKVNLLAKNILPKAFSNQLPLLYKAGDKLIYEGFTREDFPRFSNDNDRADSRYSVAYGTELTCTGWCYGYYDKEGNFQKTRNPLDEIYYIFTGRLIDNETYTESPNKISEDGTTTLHLYAPEENIFQAELNLPPDSKIRESLDYPDTEDIITKENTKDTIFNIVANSNREVATPANHTEDDYRGKYEDEKGTFRTVDGTFYIAESMLMDRINKNYYWTVERETQGKPQVIFAGYKLPEYRNAA